MPQASDIKIKKGLVISIEAIVGRDGYSISERERLSYSRDANFRSAIKAHYASREDFPGIIVWPRSTVELSQIIKLANRFGVPITTYGGGSGVCGGAMGPAGGIVVDVKRMQRLLRIDQERLFVEAECGIYGLELEKDLDRNGFTLGHFPSSILVATLGGYLAARSAGQHSSKYGKIEDMIIDLEFVDGKGEVHRTSEVSRDRGLDLTQAIVGSEGTLGIITRARLKIFPKPATRRYRAIRFQKIEYGVETLRRIMQSGIQPDVLRLYDELDSMLMFSKSKAQTKSSSLIDPFLPSTVKEALLGLKSHLMTFAFRSHRLLNTASRFSPSGCLLIVMLEGHSTIVEKQLDIIDVIAKAMGGDDVGEAPARHWHEHRYSVAFKASKLFQEGAFTDTMEVATTWDNLMTLYHGVHDAMTPLALVLAHISHVYNDGAAIYFTFVSPLNGLTRSLKSYDKIWQTALSSTQKYGGVISHHHGIGRLKSRYIRKEWGEAITIYEKLKIFFDPNGVLNPDVLIPKEELSLKSEKEAV